MNTFNANLEVTKATVQGGKDGMAKVVITLSNIPEAEGEGD